MGLEIERKFLINAFPNLPLLEESQVWQGYICTHPVVRIRKKLKQGKYSYILCFKSDGGLVRQETELEISEETFNQLSVLLRGSLISKEYKVYPVPGGLKLAFNLVDGGSQTPFSMRRWNLTVWKKPKHFSRLAFWGKMLLRKILFLWVPTGRNPGWVNKIRRGMFHNGKCFIACAYGNRMFVSGNGAGCGNGIFF